MLEAIIYARMKYSITAFLKSFYETHLGSVFVEKISEYISNMVAPTETVLMIGYADPYLQKIERANLFYAIPRGYEVNRWPHIRPFQSIEIDEKNLPFLPHCFDKIFVVNYFEFSKHSRHLLSEVYRCLGKDGKLIAIAFNKSIFFNKMKYIRNSITEIVGNLQDENFVLKQVFCVGKKSFHEMEGASFLMLKTAQLLYDMVILEATKEILATETTFFLQENFGIS